MNGKIIAVIAIVILGVGGYAFFSMNKANYSTDTMMKDTATKTATEKNAMVEQETALMEKEDKDTMIEKTDEVMMSEGSYVDYSQEEFEKHATVNGQRLVLFFYASWCPICRPVDAEFKANLNKIPANVTLFKVHYNDPQTTDTDRALAKKYGITYQHTFVQVDEKGNQITKWNGGGLSELNKNLQ